MCKWVELYGKDGMLNYNHMFYCGHLLKYMRKYKCLHRFSHQGWEHWNASVTSFFFKRTQIGGFVVDGIDKSKLWPIARWLQRRLMWITGHAATMFKERRECQLLKKVNTKVAWRAATETSSLAASDNQVLHPVVTNVS
jgi:hypothetical protein